MMVKWNNIISGNFINRFTEFEYREKTNAVILKFTNIINYSVAVFVN